MVKRLGVKPNIFIGSRHRGRFLLLICLLACSSSCMARRKALMTSGRKGRWHTHVSGSLRGPIPTGQSYRHSQRAHPPATPVQLHPPRRAEKCLACWDRADSALFTKVSRS